jgi:hydroxyacyl-ACP dehydratase HTD2-like protein with hotdog domain
LTAVPPDRQPVMRGVDIVPGAELPTTTHTYTNLELFQFSAVGWHAHRVHFDQAYTRDVEGHADLLVHGPLQAVHMVQWLLRVLGDETVVRSVSYRHLGVLHVGGTGVIGGRIIDVDAGGAVTVELWMLRQDDGSRTTTGTAVVVVGGSV